MLDREMREPLFDFIDEQFGKIRIIEEKNIERSRADVLGVLDGYIVGFEIKSDRDTYTRLKSQVKDYDRVCDFCYIVVGESHRKHVTEHVPEHWGIIAVTDAGSFLDRGADDNPSVRLEEQLKLLWKRELFKLLDMNGCPKYRDRSREFIREYLLKKLDPMVLKKQMTDLLFERDYTVFDLPAAGTGADAEKKPVRKKKRSGVKSVKIKHLVKKSISGDRKRAHTKNYIGRRTGKKKEMKKMSRNFT